MFFRKKFMFIIAKLPNEILPSCRMKSCQLAEWNPANLADFVLGKGAWAIKHKKNDMGLENNLRPCILYSMVHPLSDLRALFCNSLIIRIIKFSTSLFFRSENAFFLSFYDERLDEVDSSRENADFLLQYIEHKRVAPIFARNHHHFFVFVQSTSSHRIFRLFFLNPPQFAGYKKNNRLFLSPQRIQ